MTTHCKGIDNLIPSGNDFYLAIALKSRSLVDGEVVETPFDFEAADTYNARIYSILDGNTLSTMVGLKDGTTDTVIIDAKGVPLIRAIGVEVTGTVDGRAFRAAEKGFLSIVEFNGEAHVVFTPVTGGQQANLVMTLTFLPSAAVVGKNAYEIWKEEPGNQDKTLADFIYFLGHGESAYEIAVRYGYTGTEAEYNMLYFDAVDVANTAGQNAQQAADTANEMAAQAQDAAELADAATANANNAATAAAATVDAAIDNMEETLNAAIAAQDAEIDEQFATQTALINQKQMEIGAVPSDLKPTPNSTNWVTSGGVFDALNYTKTTEVDIASISAINFGLWGNKWHSTTNNIVTKKVDVVEGEKYYIVANSLATQIFFMATYNPVNNASVTYQVEGIAAGESAYVTVPNGMAYMVFQDDHLRTSGTPSTMFPSDVAKVDVKNVKDVVDNNSTNISLLEDVVGEMIDTTSFPSVQAFMTNANGGTWYTASSTNKGKFIPVIAGERYRIKAAEKYSYFAFLTSNSYGGNNTPVTNFASNESCHFVRNGYVTDIIAPSDAKFLFISVLNGTIDCTPTIQLFHNYNEEVKGLLADVAEITYNLDDYPLQNCLNALTSWVGSTNMSIFIPIEGGQVFRITTNNNYFSVISFHTSNVWSTSSGSNTITNYAHGEYTRHDLPKGGTYILNSPYNAKYMCVYIKSNDSTIYAPNEIVKLDVSNASVITQKLEASKLASINACRNAHVVSESKYIYTFPIDSLVLKDNEFIINYNASETSTDIDTAAGMESVIHCLDKVSILDYTTINGLEPSYTIEKTDSTVIQGFVGWTARELVDNDICVLGVCRQTNKNPFYVYAILDGDEESFVYKECKLKYTPTGGSQTTVDFTVNNYRQMLVDCGFASSYVASVAEAADNCNLCYENGVYYIFTATSPASALPLMCLKSADLETWEVVGEVLSNDVRINEVSAIVKNGIGFVMYRTRTQWKYANFAVYDIANNTLINSGVFRDAVESRPDVFTFEGDVYLAYNVLPFTYKSTTSLVRPDQGGRNEINVYKVVNNAPIFFRRICNPTGLNYFRFVETPVYEDSMNVWWNQGAIYMAYSEDRRHLYRRQFANISIADVTAVFADSEECN